MVNLSLINSICLDSAENLETIVVFWKI